MSQMDPSQAHDTPSAGQLDAQLQREIDEALGGASVEQLMEQAASAAELSADDDAAGTGGDAPKEFHHEFKRGRIAAIRGEDVFVELTGETAKLQGVVPLPQFERPPRIGSIMDFIVERIDEAQGLVFLSREGAVSRSTWEQLQRGAVVEARVIAANKGGLELEMVGGIRAFMPASQIDLHHIGELEPLVGEKLEGIVQEIDRRSKKVVLSRRQLLQQRRESSRAKLLAELEEGQIREGKVSSLADFGAFVDLGGVDGLVHVSDLSYTHVNKPGEVLKVGQTVKVKVLKIDREQQRIGLGLKQVEPDPWDGLANRIRVGEQVVGRVVRTANFGAFVEIEAGVEALLPLSEMSWTRIHKAEDVVQPGQVLRLGVLSIDESKRRISLSLKQAQGDPWVGAEHKYATHSLVDGKVISTPDFGAFVELEPGVEGLVHISELSDRRVNSVQDVLQVGDVKQFRVLEVNEDDRRIKLSLKAVTAPATADSSASGSADRPAASPARGKAGRRAHDKNLKGGMDARNLGLGLGDLKLSDL
jgi:small subunit ribosomal protein S1